MDEIDFKSIMINSKDDDITEQKKSSQQPVKMPIDLHNAIYKTSKKKPKENKIQSDTQEDKSSNTSQIDKRRLILILQMYINEFGDNKLKAFKKVNLEKMKLDALQKLKEEFDFIVSSKCNIKSAEYCFLQGVNILETVCVNFTPIQCQGLTETTNDPEFRDDIKHLCLKYMTLFKTEPEHRLVYKVLSNMLVLHQVNSIKNNHNEIINPIINEEINKINNKYDTL